MTQMKILDSLIDDTIDEMSTMAAGAVEIGVLALWFWQAKFLQSLSKKKD